MKKDGGVDLAWGFRLPSYVLVTPARNEAHYILGTLHSVVRQTHRPLRWVVVSDGSTDGTDDMVSAVASEYPWVELLRMPEHAHRHFASKARCFQAGYERLKDLSFDVVGNLDADITFEPGYLEYLLHKFALNPSLGVAGTPYVEDSRHPHRHAYAHPSADLRHVSGACQLFRRGCFEEMGGYRPLKGGTVDWTAVTQARMNGWETRTFTEMTCHHHRPVGTALRSRTGARYDQGGKAYRVGGHPAWEMLRGLWLMRQPPYFVGGLAFLAGYTGPYLTGMPRTASASMQVFHRAEQIERLRHLWQRKGEASTYQKSKWVSIKGQAQRRPTLEIQGRLWVAHGKWLRRAEIWDEQWCDQSHDPTGPLTIDPKSVAQVLVERPGFADLFSFEWPPSQPLDLQGLHHAIRWTNRAVLPTLDPARWWAELPQETRKNVRRAERRGVKIREVTWSADLARAIKRIYDESPLRQGRAFWHYGKSLEQVMQDNATYLDRATFLGAYIEDELVAFMKWVKVNDQGRIMQILALQAHQDKRPLISLIAHAVTVCHRQNLTGLIYGQMTYGAKAQSSMMEFKRRLGFSQEEVRNLVVAVTPKGRWALRWGWDQSWLERLPGPWIQGVLKLRAWWLARREAKRSDSKVRPSSPKPV